MSELRVPPAVTFHFEQVVAEVCESAMLDYDEVPFASNEILQHLENRWRDHIATGLGTDAAEALALEEFGSPEVVGKAYRKPFFKRLLYDKRTSSLRLFIIFAHGIAISYANACGIIKDTKDITSRESLLYIHQGSFLNPLIFILAIKLIHWKPRNLPLALRYFLYLRYLPAISFVGFLSQALVIPVITVWKTFEQCAGQQPIQYGYLLVALTFVFSGWLSFGCAISELFDWPGKYQK